MFGSPWMIVIAFLAVGGSFIGGYGEGIHHEHLKQQAAFAKIEAAAIIRTKAEDKITLDTSVKEAQQQRMIQYVTLNTDHFIPVYVSKQAASRCVVPRGFVELLNQRAAHPELMPVAGGQSLDSPSGVGLDTVADVVSANYGKYGEIATELKALQTWAKGISAASQSK